MTKNIKHLLAASAAAVLTAFSPVASAVPVDLELVLLTDVSGSVDTADFNLMRTGYRNAFQSAAFQNTLEQGSLGKIAVTMVYFSSSVVQSIGWTLIDTAADANAFGNTIFSTDRPFSASTGLTAGLDFASNLFLSNNGYEGTRNVIDVAGDGSESNACSSYGMNCVPLQTARNTALNNRGVTTINALWIDDRDFFGDDASDYIDALTYGTTNVIGGANAFQSIVQDFAGFETAILAKLQREVGPPTGVPEPATLGLLGLAIAGMGFGGRRRKLAA